MRMVWLVVLAVSVAGCGSGSGSQGSSGTQSNVMLPEPTSGAARVEISTQGPTADTVLYAVQFTLRLPPGVSLPTNQGNNMLPVGVLQPAPSGSYAGASLLATDSVPVLQVNISHPGGFTLGPLATLNCIVAPGAELRASGFSLYGFSARDANGAPVPGITAHLALPTQ